MTRLVGAGAAIVGALCGLATLAAADDKKPWECAASWGFANGGDTYTGAGGSKEEAIEAAVMMCVRLNRGRRAFCRDKAEFIMCRKDGELPEQVTPR